MKDTQIVLRIDNKEKEKYLKDAYSKKYTSFSAYVLDIIRKYHDKIKPLY